ncbi:MAG: Na+/H+ antiporter NhaA, partial [Calditrichaeota bacterium]|nr:Na+/H+ antiporter NhaA [Calditrichota bacterium]
TAIHALEAACIKVESPLQRMEHALHPWITFFIIPVFALANAGVSLEGNIGGSLFHPVGLGIIFGLFFGKQL